MAFFQMSEPNNFNGYLVLGYFVMWVVGMLYIFSLVMRQRNVRQDLQLLHQLLQEDDDSAEM